MAVVPSTVNLSYKQLSTNYEAKFVNYIEPMYRPREVNRIIVAENKPVWVDVIKQGDNEARVRLNSNVQSLPPGMHVVNLNLRMDILEEHPARPGDMSEVTVYLGILEVRLNVVATINLSASPSPISLNYVLGDLLEPVAVTVQSESAWTVTKTKVWLSLSSGTGYGVGGFNVIVEPSGLAVGTHTDVLTITDSLFTITVPVTLTITEADTESTYLFVQPSTMSVNYTVNGYLPIRQVELNASGNWTATASEPWMLLSQWSGFAGVSFPTFTLDEPTVLALPAGVYNGTLLFEQGGLVKTIYVTLNVYQLVESLLNDTDLYFTDDDNRIILSSMREDTFLAVEMSSTFENKINSGRFAIPFYNGRGERRVGIFPKTVIGRRLMLLDLSTPQVFAPYANALINIAITEEDVLSDQVYQTVPVNNVRFIKGSTPLAGWLSEMPPVRFMTTKGVALFSFLTNNTVDKINITGSVNAETQTSPAPNPFYTCLVPLRNHIDLKIGDEIDVTVLDQTLKVIITPDGIDHALIFWENKWGCYDVFETTGKVEVEADFAASKFKFRRNYKESETEALSIETGSSFKIETGWVRSEAEINGLVNMLSATHLYILYNDIMYKVTNSTKKLQVSETDREQPSFSLTFDNAIS